MKSPKVCGHFTLTEAAFFQMIRSTLRRKSMQWKPIQEALKSARRANESENNRLKWEYQCESCKNWHPQKNVQVDHITEVGPLTSFDHLPSFVRNLFCEIDQLRVVCKTCHDKKTYKR